MIFHEVRRICICVVFDDDMADVFVLQPGMTTQDIDDFVFEYTISLGAYPSPLNYKLFPKSVCTSVNNVACHGIPDLRPLVSGDIVNIDVMVRKKER
jgi:methionine aminopeptidase